MKKKIVPLHPLGRKTPLLPCIRYISLVLGKPCLTKISVVSFSYRPVKYVTLGISINCNKALCQSFLHVSVHTSYNQNFLLIC